MNDRIFIDTNILVYLNDESEPQKQKRAASRLAAEQQRSELVVSTQILQELYVALTRGAHPIRLPEDAVRAVRAAAKLTVVQIDPPMIFDAIAASRQHQISFWDALVIQAGWSAGCTTILTEDLTHGQALGEIRVENPFVDRPAPPEPRRVVTKRRRKR